MEKTDIKLPENPKNKSQKIYRDSRPPRSGPHSRLDKQQNRSINLSYSGKTNRLRNSLSYHPGGINKKRNLSRSAGSNRTAVNFANGGKKKIEDFTLVDVAKANKGNAPAAIHEIVDNVGYFYVVSLICRFYMFEEQKLPLPPECIYNSNPIHQNPLHKLFHYEGNKGPLRGLSRSGGSFH